MKRLAALVAVVLVGCGLPKKPSSAVIASAPPEPWRLVANQPPEVPVYLSNGFLGARVGPAGTGLAADGSALPCFVRIGYSDGTIQAGPNFLYLDLRVNGQRLFPGPGHDGYRQSLDMKRGLLTTEWRQSAGSANVAILVETFLSKANDFTAGLRAHIATDREAALEVHSGVDFRAAGPIFRNHQSRVNGGATSYTLLRDWQIDCKANVDSPGTWQVATDAVALWKGRAPSGRPVTVTEGIRWFSKALPVPGSLDYARSLREHEEAWARLWQGDIGIDGDVAMQQRVRSWLYHLYSSASGRGSVAPMGLSSTQYGGHIFWDADIWMLPAILPFHPALARGIIGHRFETLQLARKYAAETGFSGARFPWESNPHSPDERFELAPDKFPDEAHITGDVALAVNWYLKWRGPLASNEIAEQLFRETADYWVSRVRPLKDGSGLGIHHVISPDEDDYVDNDLFTNALAKWNLLFASSRALRPNPVWAKTAARLRLPFDSQRQLYLAYDGDLGKRYKQAVGLLALYPLGYPMKAVLRRRMLEFHASRTDPRGPAMADAVYAIIACELNDRAAAERHFRSSYEEFSRGPMLAFNETRKSAMDKAYFLTGAGGCLQTVLYGFAGIRLTSTDDVWDSASGVTGDRPWLEKQVDERTRLIVAPLLPSGWKRLSITGLNIRDGKYTIAITDKRITITKMNTAN